MRILAVEDDREYLEMLREVLESLGHTILLANDGAEALKLLENQTVDVIVSDVKMPGMDGLEFHEKVRASANHRNTPFVFLTGISNLDAVRAACNPDLDLLLQKPFPVDKLLQIFSGSVR